MKPKCITYTDGTKEWYLNNKLHREDGPAYEDVNGRIEWWLTGKRHREVGPAYEDVNGITEWYLNNRYYTERDYYKELLKLELITEEDYFLALI